MRLYRWLLRLCAPSMDEEYGLAMEETFARRLADARLTGRWRTIQVWVRELASVCALRRGRLLSGLGLDIRQAARRLAATPSFTLAATLTLALAIGANASIFAVVHRVVLNPLPYPASSRLIELDHGSIGLKMPSDLGVTPGLFFHYLNHAGTIESAALHRTRAFTMTGEGDAERLRLTQVTPSLGRVLRVAPALGRWLADRDAARDAAPVAIISHAFWTRRYGGAADVLGRSITLGGLPMEILGVMPASFLFPDPLVDGWIVDPVRQSDGFGLWDYSGVARLSDGASLEDARAELNGLIASASAAYPDDPRAAGNVETRLIFTGRTLQDATVGDIARPLWILLASVGVVMLVACANVANLFLVRVDARQREVAVRCALGAGRMAILRTFLGESVLLSLAGGTFGLLLAWGALRLLVASAPANLPRLEEVRLDGVILAFTCALTALLALVFGSMPLWRSTDVAARLQEAGRNNTTGATRQRVRNALLGTQVAMALVLLVASGLMVRSFQNLRAVDPGFDASSAVTFSIGLPERDYPNRRAVVAAHRTIAERLSALPGVTAVAASTCLPLAGGCSGNTLLVEGRVYPEGTIPPLALFRAVAGRYFETLGARVLRGRGITDDDVVGARPVAVVDTMVADTFFPQQDPIGQRVASNLPPDRPGEPPTLTWLTIVGVVSPTPLRTLTDSIRVPQLYVPMSMGRGPGEPGSAIGPGISTMSYVVRSRTPPLDLLPSVRRAIGEVDRNLALSQPRTLKDAVDRASAQMAFTMVLLAIAAGVALVLGVIGTYGVMAYIVRQRTGEIGVRLALGAAPAIVARQIFRHGARAAGVGVLAGLVIALSGARLIESLLFGVGPRDPAVYAATSLTLFIVALLACWIPASRAARLNPVDILRG